MANNQVSEQELQFRKRARRRLVGAIALVLLMVTVLPMVLDDRGVKAPQPEIAISIPSQDSGNFTSRIAPEAPQAAPQPMPDQQARPVPAPALPLAAPLPQTKPIVSAAQKVEPVAEKPEASVPVSVDKPTEPNPVPVESEAPLKPHAAEKPALEKAAAEKTAVKNGKFFVQIGLFADSPQLKQLEAKLAAKKFHPLHEKLETSKGEKIRVRIGPFSTRPNAEAALERLKAADLTGMIVSSK